MARLGFADDEAKLTSEQAVELMRVLLEVAESLDRQP
jgi:hypothetical protein